MRKIPGINSQGIGKDLNNTDKSLPWVSNIFSQHTIIHFKAF